MVGVTAVEVEVDGEVEVVGAVAVVAVVAGVVSEPDFVATLLVGVDVEESVAAAEWAVVSEATRTPSPTAAVVAETPIRAVIRRTRAAAVSLVRRVG